MSLDPETKEWLTRVFGGNVRFDELMSRHTSLGVGGPAEAFVAPENYDELVELVNWSRQRAVPYLVIGDGTNLLIKDSGLPGIVIVLTKCLNTISRVAKGDGSITVTAMAGVRMQSLCRFAIEQGLAGMNFALGIPGTVGGGIIMNAGTDRGSIGDVLDSIKVLSPLGTVKTIGKDELNFAYRELSFRQGEMKVYHGQPIILDGSFRLQPKDSGKLKKEAELILAKRSKSQPTGSLSAGCFFKNPESGKTAGELIELAGLKGKRKGGAQISPKHANFIINTGQASASDFLVLMELVQETVTRMFKVDLEPEVKIVGQ